MESAKEELMRLAAAVLGNVIPEGRILSVVLVGEFRGQVVQIPVGEIGGWGYAALLGNLPDSPARSVGERVLDVLRTAPHPLKGFAIARRVGVKWNSHFRSLLSRMKRQGAIVIGEEGYALPAAQAS